MWSITRLRWRWWWWWVGVMAGQQRVKLGGKEARELFLRSMSLVICMPRNLILFWTGSDKSIFLRHLLGFPPLLYLLSHILVQVQNQGFHHQSHSSLNFSQFPVPEQFIDNFSGAISRKFLRCNFLAISLAWKLVKRAPCWFLLHQYRAPSRNCNQRLRRISHKMLTRLLKEETFSIGQSARS